MKPIRIFIGYDPRESEAYHVLCNSILKRASVPVSMTPLALTALRHVHSRERDPKQSNDFSFTRFLVPYLSDYEGWSIFMDCDMLCRSDIARLYALRDDDKAVMVAKHNYIPKHETKYLGNRQHKYEKKNWSSVMLFNNKECRRLTPHYVETASGLDLHQFKWLDSEDEVGEIPFKWNHLVGEYPTNDRASLVHFTNFGPWLNTEKDEYFDDWYAEREIAFHSEGR